MTENILSGSIDPRYPIGKQPSPTEISSEELRYAVETIAELPELLRAAVEPLEEDQLDTPYREGGWTVRQVVHHVADSHTTAFFRIRLALTEDWPTVPGYNEKAFAELHDATAPVEWSLEIIEAVHARWVMVLQGLTEEQWKRGFKHAERGPMSIEAATILYEWHSKHHLAHVTELRKRLGW